MQATAPITAKRIQTGPDSLVIELTDRRITIGWRECSEKLARATPEQRFDVELSPGGYGIHWPQLDEDLSINGLVLAHDAQTKP